MRLAPRLVSVLITPIFVATQLPAQSPVVPAPAAVSAAVEQLQLRVVQAGSASKSASVGPGSRSPNQLVIEVTDANGAPVSDAAVVLRLPDTEPTGTFADGSHAAVLYTDQSGRASVAGVHWSSATGVVPIRATATKGTAHAGILIQQDLAFGPVMPAAGQPASSASDTSVLPSAVVPLPKPAPLLETRSIAKVTVPGQPAAPESSISPATPQVNSEPSVSVTSAAPGESKHSSKTKWIILAAIAAAAGGAGVAMMGKKSSTPAAAGAGLSIGTGSVSVGAPR